MEPTIAGPEKDSSQRYFWNGNTVSKFQLLEPPISLLPWDREKAMRNLQRAVSRAFPLFIH